jgi:putative (di)nucleoside polyphosphate hydrolase
MSLPSRYFRAGVGAVLMDNYGNVLAVERRKNPGAWQLPQGGLEHNETPLDAVRREIREETGLLAEHLSLVGQYPEPLAYELPREFQNEKTGMGQAQYWFFFKLNGDAREITPVSNDEVQAIKWIRFEQIAHQVISFRRRVYQHLLEYFQSEFSGC